MAPSEAKCDEPLAQLQSYIDPMVWKSHESEVARRDISSGKDRLLFMILRM